MANTAANISVVLSGGVTNINQNLSLGGAPSSYPITDGLNNLYDDISPEEAEDGHEDYRCIYFFNDGANSVYEILVWIYDDYEEGAVMEIGTQSNDEIQRITISNGPVTGGYIRINYGGHEFDSPYDDLEKWATTMETSFNTLPTLQDVTVRAQNSGSDTIIFDVTFGGRDGSQNHSVLQVVDGLNPPEATVLVSVSLEGGPVNTSAQEIGVETTPPGGVSFFAASEISPIAIPRLDPEDGFPLWIKRTIDANSDPKERDGFKIQFSAQTLEPSS